jgi:hypothetical protein
MKKYMTYLNGDLKPALMKLPDPKTFETMYGDGYLEGDLSGVPVKTIAEWLDIDLITLPPADRLTEKQQIQAAKTLLSYWHPSDELVQIIRQVYPKRRYEAAIEFLSAQAQYDGLGGFKIVEKEFTPEEWADIHEKHNAFMNKMFGDIDLPQSDDTPDDGLPF